MKSTARLADRLVCRATGINAGRCACGAPAVLLEGEGGAYRVVCPICGARGHTFPTAKQATDEWGRQMAIYAKLAPIDPIQARSALFAYEKGDLTPVPCRCGNMFPSKVTTVPHPESNVSVRCTGCGRRSMSGPEPIAILTWNLGEGALS